MVVTDSPVCSSVCSRTPVTTGGDSSSFWGLSVPREVFPVGVGAALALQVLLVAFEERPSVAASLHDLSLGARGVLGNLSPFDCANVVRFDCMSVFSAFVLGEVCVCSGVISSGYKRHKGRDS